MLKNISTRRRHKKFQKRPNFNDSFKLNVKQLREFRNSKLLFYSPIKVNRPMFFIRKASSNTCQVMLQPHNEFKETSMLLLEQKTPFNWIRLNPNGNFFNLLGMRRHNYLNGAVLQDKNEFTSYLFNALLGFNPKQD